MNPEQDPTDKNDIDPSIDPTKLIVQEGDDVGRIAAVETEEGGTIDGLPVIGAKAEDLSRDYFKDPAGHIPRNIMDSDIIDESGTKAMETEVKSRAVKLAKEQFPLASPELIEQFGQKAADKFEVGLVLKKAELESKNDEKRAEHDKGVQELIDSLDSPYNPLSDYAMIQMAAAQEAGEYEARKALNAKGK